MHKSIFTELISLCGIVFGAAVICIGVVLLIVSSENYKSDRFDFLADKSAMVLAMLDEGTGGADEGTGGADESAGGGAGDVAGGAGGGEGISSDNERLMGALSSFADAVDIDIMVTDQDGVALVCSEASPCSRTGKVFSPEAAARITAGGLKEYGSLDGWMDSDGFLYAVRFTYGGEEYILIERLRDNDLPAHMLRFAAALVIGGAMIMSVAFAIVFTSAKRLLSPIKEITLAAERFASGDFSEKLTVADENELGYLASSLNEMAGSLEELEETRRTFISNVSHELKTPMTTIGGFIDGILDGTIPQEQQRHYLEIVSAEVDRLSRLVRSMLNISKYEAGELEPAMEDFDVLPLILRTLESFEKRITEKDIDVRIEQADGFHLYGDPDLIGQVVYNLIDNAVKFTEQGGSIGFSFGRDETGMSRVTVRNSGEGLTKSEMSKVFDRFYKTDESRGIDPGGVGLGLSIVSSIIKLHGGKVAVSSERDRYTEFTFSLGGING